MKHFNMEEFANGELSRQINRDIETVMRNIADPNTEAKAARKITVTIGFKSNEQRDFITTSVNSKPTVAPALGAVTALGLIKDLETGEVEITERRTDRGKSAKNHKKNLAETSGRGHRNRVGA